MNWKPIKDYENLYSISDTGLIKSHPRVSRNGKRLNGKYLSPSTDRDGYLIVTLYGEGDKTSHRVHKLVALAFLGEPPSLLHQVAHYDGIKTNNQLSNLRWATCAENKQDAIRLGELDNYPTGINHARSKFTEQQILEIKNLEGKYSDTRIAEMFSVSQTTISRIFRGERYHDIL